MCRCMLFPVHNPYCASHNTFCTSFNTCTPVSCIKWCPRNAQFKGAFILNAIASAIVFFDVCHCLM